jgi:hydrogenase maturation protease
MKGSLRNAAIIGLGSPNGDDQLGWAAVARLARAGVADALRARDGIELLMALEGREEVIVIDASAPSGSPGRVRRIAWPSRGLAGEPAVSTHGLGLVAALRMAEALGRLPSRVTIYTVEAAASTPGAPLSAAAERGLVRLVATILANDAG